MDSFLDGIPPLQREKIVSEPIDGLLPMFVACAVKAHGLMMYLIESCQADVNQKDADNGRTALFMAVSNDDVTACNILVTHGASVNVSDNHGFTPLLYASTVGNASAVQYLVNAGAKVDGEVNNKTGRRTPLMEACFQKHPGIVKFLVDHGANIHVVGNDGNNSVMLSVAENPYASIIAFLISKGADINVQDQDGDAAILYALMSKSKESLELLLDSGARVDIKDNKRGTVLHRAVEYFCGYDIVEMLLDHGALVDSQNDDGQTPLHLAVLKGHSAEVVRLLLQHGADANIQDNSDDTPLKLLQQAEHGNNQVLLLLRQYMM